MNMLSVPGTLWAMHPRFLAVTLRRLTTRSVLPDVLGSFMTVLQGGTQAAAEPIRESAVLVLPIYGMLAPRGLFASGTAFETIIDRVLDGGEDRRVSAIVLDVRSAGGTVWGCAEAADAIYRVRALKPIIAVASPFCFSAAYWLAAQAGRFVATPSGEVGSLGVRTAHTDLSGFERKVGIRTTLIASSAEKTAAHPYAPLSEADHVELQAKVDVSAHAFTQAVARGRGMMVSAVPAVHGSGQTFSAHRASLLGAIDGLGTLRDVVARAGSSRVRLGLMRRQAAAMEVAAAI